MTTQPRLFTAEVAESPEPEPIRASVGQAPKERVPTLKNPCSWNARKYLTCLCLPARGAQASRHGRQVFRCVLRGLCGQTETFGLITPGIVVFSERRCYSHASFKVSVGRFCHRQGVLP
jgi:hypothetical protein